MYVNIPNRWIEKILQSSGYDLSIEYIDKREVSLTPEGGFIVVCGLRKGGNTDFFITMAA